MNKFDKKFNTERRTNVRKAFGDKDALLIYVPKNLYYLCGIDGFGAAGLLTSENFTLFLNENDYEIYKESPDNEICARIYKKGIIGNTIKETVRKGKISEIFVDKADEKALINLKNTIGMNIKTTDAVEKARMTKGEEEIKKIKKACEIARKGIEMAMKIYLSEKRISEHNLAAEIEYFMKMQGSEGTFEEGILLACGKNAAHIHAKPSDKIVVDAMLVDLGAKFNGYFSDLSRTFTERADNEVRQLAEFIRNLERQCVDKIYAGMKFSEISVFAEKEINKKGFKFFHLLGHGVGLDVHEMPFITNNSKEDFAENMVFTIEPGIYRANKFGIRFEDTCVIKNGKARIL